MAISGYPRGHNVGDSVQSSEADLIVTDTRRRSPFARLVMPTITTYRKSGRLFILRVTAMFRQPSFTPDYHGCNGVVAHCYRHDGGRQNKCFLGQSKRNHLK